VGRYRERLGFHRPGKKEGRFLAAAADDAVERILTTAQFREAIQ
jgi:hypothetical protein